MIDRSGAARRPARRLALLAFALGFAVSQASADLDAALDACASGFEPADPYPVEPLAGRCPRVIETLEAGQWHGTLPTDWRETLTFHEAEQLPVFMSRYRDPAQVQAVLDVQALDLVLAGLHEAPAAAERRSVWTRLLDWLAERLGTGGGPSPSWWPEWIEALELSEAAAEAMFWTFAALIVVTALGVVVFEVRAARRGKPAPPAGILPAREPPAPAWRPLALADLEVASPRDKPGVLLRLLLEALQRRGLMRVEPAATHREIGMAPTGLAAADARVLDRVTRSAERSRFAEAAGRGDEEGPAVAEGILLLERLGLEAEPEPACASA